ncbi:MAG: DUF262 domain-containing protein [Polynucleobacter sp.]|uniref:DUF262 domain-containing protein n=1 Tax=Polynucleobacter sp. TaxID=2029855 RepID=UPI002723CA1F|nr:DUF262 domain-containing protein [Polynucleobacter sp.]MDO8714339.1 DUF262 domain-containing protein [Polynucleobacter sp.]
MNINITEDLAEEGIGSGVEHENELNAHEPFDPASVSLSSKVVALDTVLRRLKNSTIILAPDFQRSYVWNPERKSLLIESMMLRIPLPMFYVSEDSNGVWEVVDGLQRLTTIRDFILGPDGDGKGFKLKDLEYWGDIFDGKNFFEIDKKLNMARIVNNMMEAELSFTIINPDTPEKVKRNIFKRINTGGMRLSSQEIRHALYQGEASKLLTKLASTENYQKIIGSTVKDDRMAGRELILRYLAFYFRGRDNFKGDMDAFLSDTMRWINGEISIETDGKYESQSVIEKFNRGLVRSYQIFGDHVFRRSGEIQRKTPINKSLFEAWMYIFSTMSEPHFQSIANNANAFKVSYFNLLKMDRTFGDSIGKHGAESRGTKYRYTKIIELIDGYK